LLFRQHRDHNKENLGQAVTLKKGFEMAKGEIVMHNAFDLPFNPWDIDKIKGAMSDDTDLVVVERQDRRSYSPYRKVISVTNVMILKSLFRCPFRDYNFATGVEFWRLFLSERRQ
jgi:hypothetical protein